MGRQRILVVLAACVFERTNLDDARVVDQHINTVAGGHHTIDKMRPLVSIAQVCRNGVHRRAARAQFCCRFV